MSTLNNKQQLALLDLYSPEIERRLQFIDETKADSLKRLLPEGTFERLKEERDHFGKNLFFELVCTHMKNETFDALLIYLTLVEDEFRHLLLNVDNSSHFNVVLSHYDKFFELLDAIKCWEYLKTIEQYSNAITVIETVWEDIDNDHRKRILLRTIAPMGPNSVYDILHTIQLDGSAEAIAFVDQIQPNFSRFYKLINQERKEQRGLVYCWPPNSDLRFFILADPIRISGAVHKVDLNYSDFTSGSRLILKTIENKLHEEVPIILREYQKELCEFANLGKNCIICAPTGSGKTIVAASIIKTHLIANKESEQAPKILFLIQNTAIIDQQRQQIEKYIGHLYGVDSICGTDCRPIRGLINSKDVIVCTPQMIVNLLNACLLGDGFDNTNEPFSLETFSLIVLDECHNAKGDSPYNALLRNYHKCMHTGRYRRPPQIIGLTASPGVGGKADEKSAFTYIIDLMSRLNSEKICTVRKNIGELLQYAPPTADECIMCDKHNENAKIFTDKLQVFMTNLETRLTALYEEAHIKVKESPILLGEDENNCPIYSIQGITKPPTNKISQEYMQWIACHRKKIIPESNLDQQTKILVTEVFDILLVFYLTLLLADDFTTKNAFTYFTEEITKLSKLSSQTDTIYTEAKNTLIKYLSTDSPLISSLEEQILRKKSISNDFRAIIFVKTREGVKILSDLLNSRGVLSKNNIQSEWMTGVNASANRREQTEVLLRFRDKNSTTRVLVSTSVAEEGLDVPECNLVIKYNYSTNEIAHVQRRGRGRDLNGQCMLITNKATIMKQEENNILKEQLMKKVLTYIEELKVDISTEVQKRVLTFREDLTKIENQNEEKIARQRASGILYSIHCKKCEEELAKSENIKIANESQHLVCTPDFWSKTIPLNALQERKAYTGLADLFCKNCYKCEKKAKVGIIVKVKTYYMPVLEATSITLVWRNNGEKHIKAIKKWKEVKENYFTPEVVRDFDLTLMSSGPDAPRAESLELTGGTG